MSDFSGFLTRNHCEALQSFFGVDLSRFTLRISRLPAAFHRLTLAEGNTIHVARAARALGPEDRAHLIAREMARLIACRRGERTAEGLAALAESEREEAAVERIADMFAAGLGTWNGTDTQADALSPRGPKTAR